MSQALRQTLVYFASEQAGEVWASSQPVEQGQEQEKVQDKVQGKEQKKVQEKVQGKEQEKVQGKEQEKVQGKEQGQRDWYGEQDQQD